MLCEFFIAVPSVVLLSDVMGIVMAPSSLPESSFSMRVCCHLESGANVIKLFTAVISEFL